MIHKLLLILITILLSQQVDSQSGYYGQKWGLRLGITPNYAIKEKSKMSYFWYNAEKRLSLPKLTIGVQKEGNNNNMFLFECTYQSLPYSEVTFSNFVGSYTYGNGYLHTTNTRDSILTLSKNIQLAIGIRKFLEVGSIGNYVELKMSNNFVFNHSQQIHETRKDYIDYNYYTYELQKKETSGLILLPQASFCIGNVIPISKKMTFDFGFKLSTIFKKSYFTNNVIPDAEVYHEAISAKKIMYSNLFELNFTLILL